MILPYSETNHPPQDFCCFPQYLQILEKYFKTGHDRFLPNIVRSLFPFDVILHSNASELESLKSLKIHRLRYKVSYLYLFFNSVLRRYFQTCSTFSTESPQFLSFNSIHKLWLLLSDRPNRICPNVRFTSKTSQRVSLKRFVCMPTLNVVPRISSF